MGWGRKKYYFLGASATNSQPSVRGIWGALIESTTTHGISHINRARGPIKRGFWSVMMTVTFIVLVYNIVSITTIFASYNLNVKIQLEHEAELTFPAVTLCNMSPVMASALENSPVINDKLNSESARRRRRSATATDSADNATCCCSCYFTTGLSGMSLDTCGACTASDCPLNRNPYATQNTTTPAGEDIAKGTPQTVPGSQYPDRVQTRESFQAEERLTEALANLPEEDKSKIGYQVSDMILDCQYAGAQCYYSQFSSFYNPVHGNCYIFNSGWNESHGVQNSRKAGRRYGLHLIVNIDQDEYVKDIGDTAGIRLVVHTQTRMPFPEDEGITVAPGRATSLGLKQVTIERETIPYGSCQDPSKDTSSFNVYEELYPIEYSTSACQKTCYQRHVIEKCGCADASYPTGGKAFGSYNVKACDTNDVEQGDCRYVISKLFIENNLTCDCPNSCKERVYEFSISTGTWPSNVQKESLLQKLSPQIGHLLSDASNPDKYKDNLIKLEIYYEELNFQDMTEIPSYPPQKYLSDLGGTLGLWLGMSMLSIVEFGEFFMDLLMLAWIKLWATGATAPGGDPTGSQADIKEGVKQEMKQYDPSQIKAGDKTQSTWLPGPLRNLYFGDIDGPKPKY